MPEVAKVTVEYKDKAKLSPEETKEVAWLKQALKNVTEDDAVKELIKNCSDGLKSKISSISHDADGSGPNVAKIYTEKDRKGASSNTKEQNEKLASETTRVLKILKNTMPDQSHLQAGESFNDLDGIKEKYEELIKGNYKLLPPASVTGTKLSAGLIFENDSWDQIRITIDGTNKKATILTYGKYDKTGHYNPRNGIVVVSINEPSVKPKEETQSAGEGGDLSKNMTVLEKFNAEYIKK